MPPTFHLLAHFLSSLSPAVCVKRNWVVALEVILGGAALVSIEIENFCRPRMRIFAQEFSTGHNVGNADGCQGTELERVLV